MQAGFEIVRILHDIATAWGVGGVTIAFLLLLKGDRDKELAPIIRNKLMPLISKVIMIGLLLLIVSGIGLLYLTPWPLGDFYLIKHIFVVALLCVGISMGAYVMPRRNKLAPTPGNPPSKEFLKFKRLARALHLVNLILWYVITVLSVVL